MPKPKGPPIRATIALPEHTSGDRVPGDKTPAPTSLPDITVELRDDEPPQHVEPAASPLLPDVEDPGIPADSPFASPIRRVSYSQQEDTPPPPRTPPARRARPTRQSRRRIPPDRSRRPPARAAAALPREDTEPPLELPAPAGDREDSIPKRTKRKKFQWRRRLGRLKLRTKRSDSGEKMEKVKRPTKPASARWIQGSVLVLLFFLFAGTVRGCTYPGLAAKEKQARQGADGQLSARIQQLRDPNLFAAMPDAIAKAVRFADECFNVPNVDSGEQLSGADLPTVQNKALADAGISAGGNLNCGWDGNGRGQVIDHQVVSDPYWTHTDRATVILQLKLYQQPGFIYYFVPFTGNGRVAKFAGMPAIFGTASGARDFLTTCNEPSDTVDTGPLGGTAQAFLNALAGDNNFNLGYLTYSGRHYGGFGPGVSSPKVTQVTYCGSKGQERQIAALVRFSGPVKGAHYTLPYAFGLVPNPQTNGNYQVKDFGPAPGYTGS